MPKVLNFTLCEEDKDLELVPLLSMDSCAGFAWAGLGRTAWAGLGCPLLVQVQRFWSFPLEIWLGWLLAGLGWAGQPSLAC